MRVRSLPVRGGRWEPARPGKEMPVSNMKKCYTTHTRLLIESLQRKKGLLCFYFFFLFNPNSEQKEKLSEERGQTSNPAQIPLGCLQPSKQVQLHSLDIPDLLQRTGHWNKIFHVCLFHVTKIRKEQKITGCTETHRPRGTFLSVRPVSNPRLARLTRGALETPATSIATTKHSCHSCNSSSRLVKSHGSITGVLWSKQAGSTTVF